MGIFGGGPGGGSRVRCSKCGRELSASPNGIYYGSGVFKLDDAPYKCRSCGAPFCVDCVTGLKRGGACPKCGRAAG